MCFLKLFRRGKKKEVVEKDVPEAEVEKIEAVPEQVAAEEPPEVICEEVTAEELEEIPAEEASSSEAEVCEEVTQEAETVEEAVEEITEPVTEAQEEHKTDKKPSAVGLPVAVRSSNGKVFVRIRYNRSFIAKIIQSDDKLKTYYGEIRNELMRYKVKTRVSWKYETFKTGRKLLAKISVRGKTLSLYLALDPAAYADTKYKIDDVSSVAKNADVPTLYKIKNDRRCKYAKELIADLMNANGLEAGEAPADDYTAIYPYEELEPLLERGLVKLLKWQETGSDSEEGLIEITEEKYEEIAATDEDYSDVVDSISVGEAESQIDDEEVETFVQESERVSDKSKKDIVNIDALGKYFKAGETVTVEEIRKRVPAVHPKTTYIKVLARGRLDKPLNVEADDFSPAAIKMIVLTGGTVSRTKSK